MLPGCPHHKSPKKAFRLRFGAQADLDATKPPDSLEQRPPMLLVFVSRDFVLSEDATRQNILIGDRHQVLLAE